MKCLLLLVLNTLFFKAYAIEADIRLLAFCSYMYQVNQMFLSEH